MDQFNKDGVLLVDIVTEPDACRKCCNLAEMGPFKIENCPNCRCGKIPHLSDIKKYQRIAEVTSEVRGLGTSEPDSDINSRKLLPDCNNLVIPDEKVIGYALNPDHICMEKIKRAFLKQLWAILKTMQMV